MLYYKLFLKIKKYIILINFQVKIILKQLLSQYQTHS
jgi:hypothetical protein